MKKFIIILFIITIITLLINGNKETSVLIPKSAIRYRIIANSNEPNDQEKKLLIKNELDPLINNILVSSSSLDSSRNEILENIPLIKTKIDKYTTDYDINYGLNYFPEKTYKDITYDEGNYESLVITLGAGLGDNWWCVLFPPLCLLEADEKNVDNVTYSLYAKKIIDKFY
ncbi:MAG: stage II sporulation protein R [Bacilli bacterium]